MTFVFLLLFAFCLALELEKVFNFASDNFYIEHMATDGSDIYLVNSWHGTEELQKFGGTDFYHYYGSIPWSRGIFCVHGGYIYKRTRTELIVYDIVSSPWPLASKRTFIASIDSYHADKYGSGIFVTDDKLYISLGDILEVWNLSGGFPSYSHQISTPTSEYTSRGSEVLDPIQVGDYIYWPYPLQRFNILNETYENHFLNFDGFDTRDFGLPLVTDDHKDFTWITPVVTSDAELQWNPDTYQTLSMSTNFDPSVEVYTKEKYPDGYSPGHSGSPVDDGKEEGDWWTTRYFLGFTDRSSIYYGSGYWVSDRSILCFLKNENYYMQIGVAQNFPLSCSITGIVAINDEYIYFGECENIWRFRIDEFSVYNPPSAYSNGSDDNDVAAAAIVGTAISVIILCCFCCCCVGCCYVGYRDNKASKMKKQTHARMEMERNQNKHEKRMSNEFVTLEMNSNTNGVNASYGVNSNNYPPQNSNAQYNAAHAPVNTGGYNAPPQPVHTGDYGAPVPVNTGGYNAPPQNNYGNAPNAPQPYVNNEPPPPAYTAAPPAYSDAPPVYNDVAG